MTPSLAVLGVTLCLLLGNGQAQADQEDKISLADRIRTSETIQPIGYLSRSNFNFTSTMYSAMSRQQGNIIFSPFSIHSILVMTSLGAKGDTLEEMKKGLCLLDENITTAGYQQITDLLNSLNSEDLVVNVANKIYLRSELRLNKTFLKKTKTAFETEIESVDFSQDPSDVINEWVEENTNHKIKDIIQPGTLDALTMMVLVNAIYMKGKWLTEFDPQDTTERPFHLSETESVPVPMMHVSSNFRYKEMENTGDQVLELPYTGDTLSMFIILPKIRNGIVSIETEITEKGLRRYTRNLDDAEVELWLPRFRFEKATDLVPHLKKMGMNKMFQDTADFSGMVVNNDQLKVSDVAHKAFIEVNEEGTEAAGATMVMVQALSLNSPTSATFEANHPFIFLIYHKESKQVLFMGRYALPE